MVMPLLLAALVGLLPPTGVHAFDTPNDQGRSITVTWTAPEAESALLGHRIYRSVGSESTMVLLATEPAASSEYVDGTVTDGVAYRYAVEAFTPTEAARGSDVGPTTSRAQWFNTARVNILVALAAVCTVFFVYMALARRGRKMFIRKIAGLDAIDEALGRATEMGKPLLFSFGLGVITDIVVIAALPLLRRIARRSAEYSTRLLVPNSDPIVMTAAQETVKEAYTEAGRPDLYNADNVNFLTSDQFGYAAGVDGIILREKPGAIFWLGYFYAESLIMAETGHSVGAIQLAGTTETTQLPFFVAACDYTMIGEEIYAASCYLRPEPVMLGTIKGEDFIRVWLIVLTAVIVALGTLDAVLGHRVAFLASAFERLVAWFTPAY